MASQLSKKSCVACSSGTLPLDRAAAEHYLTEVPGWTLDAEATKIERRFTFENFIEAMSFVQKVGALAEAENHHPDIAFGWGYASILFQTHSVGGLHDNDFVMAAKVNALHGA